MRWSYRTKTKGVKPTKARGVNLGIDKTGQVHAPETKNRNNELKTNSTLNFCPNRNVYHCFLGLILLKKSIL